MYWVILGFVFSLRCDVFLCFYGHDFYDGIGIDRSSISSFFYFFYFFLKELTSFFPIVIVHPFPYFFFMWICFTIHLIWVMRWRDRLHGHWKDMV